MANFTKVNPGDPIQAVQLNQVIDALIGTSASTAVPIAVTAVNDATNYAVTIQNDEVGNSRALNVLKSDGTSLIKADASGVTLGSPLNLPANSITSAAIQDAGVHNVDLASDTARLNLLTNGGMEIWQRGAGPFSGGASPVYTADRWTAAVASGDTMSVQQTSSVVDSGSYSAQVTYTRSTGGSQFGQSLADAPAVTQLRGRTVSLSMRVRCNTANAVQLAIYDGTSWAQSGVYHSGGGTFETLSYSRAVASAATNLLVAVWFTQSCTAYVDNAMLVLGSQYADYAPMHPADDLARCQRYYERWDQNADGGTPYPALGATQANTLDHYFVLPFKTYKAVVPSFTTGGVLCLVNAPSSASSPGFSAFISDAINKNGARLHGTTTAFNAAGAVAFLAYSSNGWFAFEANP